MRKKILAIILSLSMILGSGICTGDVLAAGVRAQSRPELQEDISREMPTGRIRTEEKELPAIDTREKGNEVDDEALVSPEKSVRSSAVYNHSWDKYKNHYFYNQMTEEEKEFYDKLDTICLKYLTTAVEAEQTEGGCYMDIVKLELKEEGEERQKEWETWKNILEIFRFSNPQYYFLDNTTWGDKESGNIALGIYRSFAAGADREAATKDVKAQLDIWESQIAEGNTEEERVKIIHDLVVNKVTYNYGIEDEAAFDEETEYSQTAYSVLCMDTTVCTGYSKAFEMLCNGAGIDAVAVTSPVHAWNKVRLNDSWYNVDCTWDDSGDAGRYDFFERNDAYFDTLKNQSEVHREEEFWLGILPVCSLDSAPQDGYTPGTLPVITEQTETPGISLSDNMADITSATEGAVIYYSLDGTEPSPSSVKCQIYRGAFTVPAGKKVKAVAVCDAHLDSETAEEESTSHPASTQAPTKKPVSTPLPTQKPASTQAPIKKPASTSLPTKKPAVKYDIVYKLNGGKNNSRNPLYYHSTSASILLKNPTKRGYTFKGWYADSSYRRRVTQIAKGSTGTKTLYARWKANKYKIVFKGNGKTKGKMKAMTSRKYGKRFRLRANKFKRKGYTFAGWSTKKNGKGKRFANKQKVKNLTSKANGKVILYVRWKRK